MVDLKKLEKKLDNALKKETAASLKRWLQQKRKKQKSLPDGRQGEKNVKNNSV